MLNFVLQDGISDLLSTLLIYKLGRVAAHEDDSILASKFLLEELQVWQHVQAVYAAVGPEVNQSEFAAQVTLQ